MPWGVAFQEGATCPYEKLSEKTCGFQGCVAKRVKELIYLLAFQEVTSYWHSVSKSRSAARIACVERTRQSMLTRSNVSPGR